MSDLESITAQLKTLTELVSELAREHERVDRLYFSPKEIAEAIGLHHEHVLKLIRGGQLPASNVGSDRRPTYRVSRTDLDLFMQSRRVRWSPSRSERDALADKWLGKKLAT